MDDIIYGWKHALFIMYTGMSYFTKTYGYNIYIFNDNLTVIYMHVCIRIICLHHAVHAHVYDKVFV